MRHTVRSGGATRALALLFWTCVAFRAVGEGETTRAAADPRNELIAWLGAVGTDRAGPAPWTKPDFHDVGRESLAADLRELAKERSLHNPVVRVWVAAALAAADDPEGLSRFDRELESFRAKLPGKATEIEEAVNASLAKANVKAVLPLSLRQAERQIGDIGRTAEDSRPTTTCPPALRRFFRLAGWLSIPPNLRLDYPLLIEHARLWTEKNYARLEWNPDLGCFTGAPGPTLAALEEAEKLYGVRLDPQWLGGASSAEHMLLTLVGLMEKNPDAAANADLEETIRFLVEPARSFGCADVQKRLLVSLPKANRQLGVNMLADRLRNRMRFGGKSLRRCLDGVFWFDFDRTLLVEARATLRPEMQAAYEQSAGMPLSVRLPRAFACRFTKGNVDIRELNALVDEAIRRREDIRLRAFDWTRVLAESGDAEGLTMMLACIEAAPVASARKQLRMFAHLSGIPRMLDHAMLDRQGIQWQVVAGRRWLTENRERMEFLPEKARFRLREP